jgi:hypothetical protein
VRRALIAAVAALSIALAALAAIFAFSEFRSRSRRPPHQAFGDFCFVLDTGMRQVFGVPLPEPSEAAYRSAMGHARSGAHRFVDDAIEQHLVHWGEPALPWLARELDGFDAAAAERDFSRVYAAIAGIGEIGGPRAARILVDWLSSDGRLETVAGPTVGGGVLSRIAIALGRMRDPLATGLLIELHRRGYSPRAGDLLLDSIGRSRTPNATSFLLEEYARARSEAEIDALIWPLAFTHDPRAGAIVVGLRLHPSQ